MENPTLSDYIYLCPFSIRNVGILAILPLSQPTALYVPSMVTTIQTTLHNHIHVSFVVVPIMHFMGTALPTCLSQRKQSSDSNLALSCERPDRKHADEIFLSPYTSAVLCFTPLLSSQVLFTSYPVPLLSSPKLPMSNPLPTLSQSFFFANLNPDTPVTTIHFFPLALVTAPDNLKVSPYLLHPLLHLHLLFRCLSPLPLLIS